MQKIERRITELESQAERESENRIVRLVSIQDGETNEQAILRAGYSPDDDKTIFVCLVGLERNPHSSST